MLLLRPSSGERMAGRLGKVYTHIDCFIFITHVEIHILVLAYMLNSLVVFQDGR